MAESLNDLQLTPVHFICDFVLLVVAVKFPVLLMPWAIFMACTVIKWFRSLSSGDTENGNNFNDGLIWKVIKGRYDADASAQVAQVSWF
jgi:hypothetical protein